MVIKLSDHLWERYLLEELPEKRVLEIRSALETDANAHRRLEAMAAENVEILKQYPAADMADNIRERCQAAETSSVPTSRFRGLLLPALSVAATVVVLFAAWPVIQNIVPGPEHTRLKGRDAALYIFRKQGEYVEQLKNGSKARAGELLQLAYVSYQHDHGIILSFDSRGVVTLHHPLNPEIGSKLETNIQVSLTLSYELDDAPRFERFIFITSPSALDIAAVLAATQALAERGEMRQTEPLLLDAAVQQISILIDKED
ncbi:hypothetical protein KAR10_07190 [bacterium]|nr:hypothetical protein [bacterium]